MKQICEELDNLFESCYKKAYRAAKCICMDSGSAEDAVSEALIRMWKTFSNGKKLANAEAFFLRISINEARRIAARRSEIPSENVADYLDELIMRYDETLMYAEEARELLAAVDALPARLSLPLKLHYYGGFSEKETAAMLNVSYSALKTRLHRARQKLKDRLLSENGSYGGKYNET